MWPFENRQNELPYSGRLTVDTPSTFALAMSTKRWNQE
jgi:hypothetical protein